MGYFSNDPAQRTWISNSVIKERAYGPFPVEGDAMPSGFLGRVLKSKSSKWQEGALVNGFASWSEYITVNEHAVFPARYVRVSVVECAGVDPSHPPPLAARSRATATLSPSRRLA